MANRAKTLLLYAESGNTKTSQGVFISRYIKEKYNKKTRLISSDGGGWSPIEDENLIYDPRANPDGLVHAFNMTNRNNLLADWRKLAKGQWPKVVKGEAHLGEDVTKMYRKFQPTSPEEWKDIGCYFIEGLTSVGSGFISHISKQDNSKDSVSKVMYAAPGYDEDGEHFGATDQGHIGMVQNELNNLTQQFGTLPVELVVWTALVGVATDKSLRAIGIDEEGSVYGPKLSGNAKTAESPSWFSDCLHLDSEITKNTLEDGGNTQTKRVFAFFERHQKIDGSTYLAKSSTGPTLYPKLKERFKGGYVELFYNEGIDRYLKVIDELKNGGK